MGLVMGCTCKKCGYRFEADMGVGLMYPKTYQSTIDKIRKGFYGQQGKEFLEVFPNGAISREEIVVQCDDCRKLTCVPDLTLYIPKEDYDPDKRDRSIPWSSACTGKDREYVSPDELEVNYEAFERYNHRCPYCNSHASVLPGFTEDVSKNQDKFVHCPNCGSLLEIEIEGLWD